MIVKQWLKEIIHEMWNSRDLRSPVFISFNCALHQVIMANGKLEHNDDISLSVHILHFIIILFRKFNMKTKCWLDDMYWDNSRIKLKPGSVKVSRLKFKLGKNNYNCRPGSVKLKQKCWFKTWSGRCCSLERMICDLLEIERIPCWASPGIPSEYRPICFRSRIHLSK